MPLAFGRGRTSVSIPIIITINVVVFLLWNLGGRSGTVFMAQNFLVSWDSIVQGRYWTLLTSAFSHNYFWHIFFNMYVLSSFGSIVEDILGTKRFLFFYFLAAVISSFCHAFVSAFFLGDPSIPALGASGAIAGLILLFALLFPKEKIYLMALVPIPALWGAVAFIGLDIWGLIAQSRGGGLPIGHGAHIGGSVTGIVFYFAYLRRRMRFL